MRPQQRHIVLPRRKRTPLACLPAAGREPPARQHITRRSVRWEMVKRSRDCQAHTAATPTTTAGLTDEHQVLCRVPKDTARWCTLGRRWVGGGGVHRKLAIRGGWWLRWNTWGVTQARPAALSVTQLMTPSVTTVVEKASSHPGTGTPANELRGAGGTTFNIHWSRPYR